MTIAGTAAATAPTLPPTVPTAAARQAGPTGSTTTASVPSSRALPSPSIPSPSSMPNSSTPASSINTPTSGQQPYDDLDARVVDFRQRWLAVKSHPGPDMATPCPEYVTFLPRVGDPSTWYSSVWNMGQGDKEWVVPPMPAPIAEKYAGFLHGQYASRKGDLGRHSSSSGQETNGSIAERNKSRFHQNPPTPPLEEIRKNIEMIRNLPPLMSPSIPTWPEPSTTTTTTTSATVTSSNANINTSSSSHHHSTNNTNGTTTTTEDTPIRRLTGGKQPGKVPHMPANLGVSSDDDDSDDSDAFSDSNRATSDSDRGDMMSEIETSSRGSKSVGGKSKVPKEPLRGKRPSSSAAAAAARASKTVSEPPKSPPNATRARKSSAGSHCALLSKSQVAELAQQRSDMTLSSNPVVIRINIPSSMLPALKSLPRAIEKSKTSSSSTTTATTTTKKRLSGSASSVTKKSSGSKSKSYKERWGSDSDSDMDRSIAGTASERDDAVAARFKTMAKKKESSFGRQRVSGKDSPRRRRRSYDTDDSDSEDRKKPSRKSRDSKARRGSDESEDDKGRKRSGAPRDDWSTSKKRRRDTSPISPPLPPPLDTKRSGGGSLDSTASNRRDSVLESSNSHQDARRKKYDEPGRRSTDRPADGRTLSPAEERARDRLRRLSYHSADERELADYDRSHSSMDARDRLDAKGNEKPPRSTTTHSRRESEASKDKGILRDRDEKISSRPRSAATAAAATAQDHRKDEKDKEQREQRGRDKDRETASGRRDTSKDAGRIGSKPLAGSKDPSTAAAASPNRRPGRGDDYREKSSRSTIEAREAAAAGAGTTTTTTSGSSAAAYKDRGNTNTTTSTTKERHATSRTHSRSRSRSRSRSPARSGRYDRRSPTRGGGERDTKPSSRRDYDDERNPSSSSRRKADGSGGGRARDTSRERSDRRGRSRERSGRDRSRSPDRDWSRDRKRARSRDYADSRESRKDKDRRGGGRGGGGSVSPPPPSGSYRSSENRSDPSLGKSALAAQEGSSSKSSVGGRHDGDKEKEKEGRATTSSASTSQARRPSQAVRDDGADAKSSAQDTKTSAGSMANGSAASSSAAAGNSALASAAAASKKTTISMADYQKKRAVATVSESMDTPKMASDSPALASSSSMNGRSSSLNPDSSKASSSSSEKRSKPTPSPEVSKKMNEYLQVFNFRTGEGAEYKHTADATRTAGDNPRLCAIQYFMASIEFIAAYVANDKYHLLANLDRPDNAVHDSIGIWETMRQFTSSVTHQCRSNHLTGLDGLSALLEVLVYHKVYNYHMLNLRATMLGNNNFKLEKKEDKDKEVLVPKSLTSRMLQCTSDWYHINKRSDEVKMWFTISTAQKAFPDSFAKYCLSGKETSAAERLVPGTNTQKLQFPLGLHSDLQEVMTFAESALREFQKRNGLEFVKQKKE